VASLSTYYTSPGTTTVPLRGMPPLTSALVWVADRETAAIRAFARVAAQVVGQAGPVGQAET
jgi:hypothetical protein